MQSSMLIQDGLSGLQVTRSAAVSRQIRHRCWRTTIRCQGGQSNKGLGVLEWTGSLVPQGALVKGAKTGWRLLWETFMRELAPQTKDGSYSRPSYLTLGRIGDAAFPSEAGRYHVYTGNACPWCHRVLLTLAVRGLSGAVGVTRMADDPERASRGGWVMDEGDPVFGAKDLREVYDALIPGYKGRCTAPLLVDKKSRRLVSNESSDIIRMLNSMDLPGVSSTVDLCPPQLLGEIDAINAEIYPKVNNGVYRAGFATSQAGYDAAVSDVFSCLDKLEQRLQENRFLLGDRLTEADLRLFPTAVRFDAAYYTLFRCSTRRWSDYPSLQAWLLDVHNLQVNGGQGMQIRDTFDVDEARRSYFSQLFPLNPSCIVPAGPSSKDLAFDRPAGRGPTHPEDVFFHRQPAAQAAAAPSSAPT